MQLSSWLEQQDIEYAADKVIFLSIVTDGLNIKKNQLVGFILLDGQAASPFDNWKGYFLPGRSVDSCSSITGLIQSEYSKQTVPLPEIMTAVKKLTGKTVISYNLNQFTFPFLNQLTELTGLNPVKQTNDWIDVQKLWACCLLDRLYTPEGKALSVNEVNSQKEMISMDLCFLKTGLTPCWGQTITSLKPYQRRICQLYFIWQYMLYNL